MRSRKQTIAIILSKFKKRFGGARFQSTTDMTYRSGAADNVKISNLSRIMRDIPEQDPDKIGTSAGGRTGWLIPQANGKVLEHSADPSVRFKSHADLLQTAPDADRTPLGLVGSSGNYPKALKAGWVRFSHGNNLFMANFNANSSQHVVDFIKKKWAGQPIALEMEFIDEDYQVDTVSGRFDDDKKALRWINEQKAIFAERASGGKMDRPAGVEAQRARNQNNINVQLDVAKGLAKASDERFRKLKAKLKKPRIKKSMEMAF